MAAELREALPGAAGDQVFHRVGDVALHAEAALAPPDAEAPPAAAEFVAASTRFALVFFGDTLGARPAAHARHVRSCRPRIARSLLRRSCVAFVSRRRLRPHARPAAVARGGKPSVRLYVRRAPPEPRRCAPARSARPRGADAIGFAARLRAAGTRCCPPTPAAAWRCRCVPPAPLLRFPLTRPRPPRLPLRFGKKGLRALHLSPDETELAVHHAAGVDVHHVARFMAGDMRPVRTLCAGCSPLQFQWRVPCRALRFLFCR